MSTNTGIAASVVVAGIAAVVLFEIFGGPVGANPLPLRLLLGVLLLVLCMRVDDVAGHLARTGTPLERDSDRRCTRAVLLVLVAVGFSLRIPDIAVAGPSWDEAMFIWVGSSVSLGDLWHSVSTRSPHPAGYFALLNGILEWTWDLYWLRLPSVIAGSALIWAGYVFVRRLAGYPAALVMAVAVTFAPTLVELSRVARNYTIAFLVGLLAATYFVGFLQRERPREALVWALAGAASIFLHFCFLVVFAAQYLQVAATGLLRRRGPSWWIRLAASQLPVLLAVAGLYVFHIRRLDPMVVTAHESLYHLRMEMPAVDLLAPIESAWMYLAPLDLGWTCFVAYGFGLVLLLARGMYSVLFVCVLPVVAAYAFSWSGRYPLHGSRHAAYLFPYLFAPVAVLAAEMASAGLGLRRRFGIAESDAQRSSRLWTWASRIGVALVGAALACFVDAAMIDYRSPVSAPVSLPRRIPEFLLNYRVDDIDRAFRIVEERATQGDLVLVTTQALYEMRRHYRIRPLPLEESRGKPELDMIAGPAPRRLTSWTAGGVRYVYSPRTGLWLSIHTLMNAVEDIQAVEGRKKGANLWVIRGGWDVLLSDRFRKEVPNIRFDKDVDEETGGVLFRVGIDALAPITAYRRMMEAKPGRPAKKAVPTVP